MTVESPLLPLVRRIKLGVRLCIAALILLPIFLPFVASFVSVFEKASQTVWVDARLLNASENLPLVIKKHLRGQLSPQTKLTLVPFGDDQGPAPLAFDALLGLLKRLPPQSELPLVVSPGDLWGAPATTFVREVERLQRPFSGQRLSWFFPSPISAEHATSGADWEGLALGQIFAPALSFLSEESLINLHIIGRLQPYQKETATIILRIQGALAGTHELNVVADESGWVNEWFTLPLRFEQARTQTVSAELTGKSARERERWATTTVSVAHTKSVILHIGFSPNWELRTLRQKLKSWPNLELLSYYILREATDDLSVPSEQLSLIQFPVDKLFGEQLPNFHGIIVQNFPLGAYLNTQESAQLRGAVESGSRIFFASGPRSFDSLDSQWQRLFPCKNKAEHRHVETPVSWEPTPEASGLLGMLSQDLSALKTHSFFAGCEPKAGVLTLARSKPSGDPLLLLQRVGTGLVLSALSDDWHILSPPSHARLEDTALQAKAIDGLFRWVVEFLQRRHDAGLRAPDLAGPRIYPGQSFFLLQPRSQQTTQNTNLFLNLSGADQEPTEGTIIHLPHLGLEGLWFKTPPLLKAVQAAWAESNVNPFLKLQLSLPPAHPEPYSPAIVPDSQGQEAPVGRWTPWPFPKQGYAEHGAQKTQIELKNLWLEKALVEQTLEGSHQKNGTMQPKEQNALPTIQRVWIPLLKYAPYLLALCLILLAFEQLLARCQWAQTTGSQKESKGLGKPQSLG